MKLPGIFNGAPIPNWVRLVALGFVLASVWFGQKSAVSDLQKGQAATVAAQEEMTKEIKALRIEMRDGFVSRAEFNLLTQRVDASIHKIESLDDQLWATRRGR
jgi:hypothetical protein